MKELIKKALSELENLPYSSTKKTVERKLDLDNYPSVAEISKLAEKVGLPLNKIFIGTEECNTLGGASDVYLAWDEQVDKSKEEIALDVKKRFNNGAWKRVYDMLTANGFTRTSCSTSEFKKFDQYNVHDLYYAGEWDILEAYYSLRFKKEVEPLA